MSGPVHTRCGRCGGGLLALHQPWCPRQSATPAPAPQLPQSKDAALIALFEDYCTRADDQLRRLAVVDNPEDAALAFARASVYLECAEDLHTAITKVENTRSTTAS